MNPYGNCVELQEIMNALSVQMDEAYNRMKSTLVQANELTLDIPPNTQELDTLKKQADVAYKEITKLGKQRLYAFYQWIDCLIENNSN